MATEKTLRAALLRERKARLEAERRLEEHIAGQTSGFSHHAAPISNIIANMQEGVLVEDENRLITLVNEAFCAMFGIPFDPEVLVGADCSGSAEQFKHLFKEPDVFVSGINDLLSKRKKVTGEIHHLKDGRTFSRDYNPIIIQGAYKGHFWKYIDITSRRKYEDALRRSEEKYRLLIENINLGLLEVDLYGRVIYANQSFCEMSGFEREEIYGKVAENIFTASKNRDLVSKKNEARKQGISDAYELEITNKKGLRKWWLISGAPLYNNEGSQVGSTGIHLDITGRKQLEFTLREAKQMAEDTAKAKEIFLANMSHEIRTPMNAILGLGKQLLKTDLSTYQRSFLESITTSADNLLVIINDILDFSKIESGKLDLESIDFSLPALLDQVSTMLSNKAEEKGLKFELHMDGAIAPVLKGDPYRINQILLNLLSNSIKFTDQGSISLICNVEESHTDRQDIELSVADTGIGVDKKYMKKIFQKFSQESVNVARKYGGTGLGMAITKQLVDLMDGKISIESQKNKGTKVSIRITLPNGREQEKAEKPKLLIVHQELRGKKILLVEDNKLNRLVAKTILAHFGIEVTEAVNGEIAVDILRKESFNLVLMDMQMPVMDGIDATLMIRKEISTTIPIIALTAHALKSEEARCREAGMNDFISKPFEEEKLLNVLSKFLT
ncbi:MAG: PAS domain S-box protein [Bacteroidota bacterium]